MEPAVQQREQRGADHHQAVGDVAAMEPAVQQREQEPAQGNAHLFRRAAMEPAVQQREQGSQNPDPLTCGYSKPCERSFLTSRRQLPDGLVKVQKWPLTSVRALPGAGLTTSALALTRLPHSMMAVSHGDRGTGSGPPSLRRRRAAGRRDAGAAPPLAWIRRWRRSPSAVSVPGADGESTHSLREEQPRSVDVVVEHPPR